MRQLFLFIYNYRAFFVFVAFEGLSAFLVVQNQNYHKAAFINSSNVLAGNIVEISSNIFAYFKLKSQNEELSRELTKLQQEIALLESRIETGHLSDIPGNPPFSFIPAKVVNNSYRQLNNYLTLNKGSLDGIKPNQGVIGINGIVGKVRSSSKNFSIVVSVLHTDFLISSVHNRSETFCTLNWDGRDPTLANLLYVPRHVFLSQGDTISTSGYNSIFPEGQFVGVIERVTTSPNETFHKIRVKLGTNFSQINFVSVVESKLVLEKDSLERNAVIIN